MKATHCDVCKMPLTHQFVDGKTRNGQWAVMCLECHHAYGVGLGTGKGQKYDKVTGCKIAG